MRWLKKKDEPSKTKEPAKAAPKRKSIMRNDKSDTIPARRQSSLKPNNQQQLPRRQSQNTNNYQARGVQEDNYYEENEEEQPVFEAPVEQMPTENLTTKRPNKNPQEKLLTNFVQKHPITTSLIAMLVLIILILAIVLPLALVKRTEERAIIHK